MRTSELLIVFGALMALIALVAVAIDWVGKPLRNRRFIPRIYRYGDEIVENPEELAVSATTGYIAYAPPVAASAAPATALAARPVNQSLPAFLAPDAPQLRPATPAVGPATPSVSAVPAALAPTAPPIAAQRSAETASTTSAFSDSVDPGPQSDNARIASTVPVESAEAWNPSMALDSRVRDQSPTPAEKAERVWKTFAHRHGAASHFDQTALALMADGKAPRRRNPRTGSIESIELVGLRAASELSDVRMLWPGDSADPWSGA